MEIIQIIGNIFTNFKKVPIETINYNKTFRDACAKNVCGNYNRNWTCPPVLRSIPELEDRLRAYKNLIIFYKVYKLRREIDFRTMLNSLDDFQLSTSSLKKELIKEGYDFVLMGAGGCKLCPRCSYIDNEPCLKPNEAVSPIEGFGIDVSKLMKDNNLPYDAGEKTVTYIGAIIYKS